MERVGIRPEDGPTDCPRDWSFSAFRSFSRFWRLVWHRWKPLWCATQGVMTSEDFCRTRHDRVRPGTTGYDQVRPGTTGMKCPAMSGWLWIGSTQPLGKCEGTRMDKDLTGTGQGRE